MGKMLGTMAMQDVGFVKAQTLEYKRLHRKWENLGS
jgi:hypothetical protein